MTSLVSPTRKRGTAEVLRLRVAEVARLQVPGSRRNSGEFRYGKSASKRHTPL